MGPAVYLDYNATTPVDPRVLEKMLPFFSDYYGNPSSEGHSYGWAASAAVEAARRQVAEALGARPANVTFTSGASEGINTAIKGIARAYAGKGRHIITVKTEHQASLRSCRTLEAEGFRVTYLPVDGDGLIDLDELESALTGETILVNVMWANNETGVIHPVSEIAARVRDRGILFMTDATQAVGKFPVTVAEVDVLVCSGHKLYGPKGVGVLYLRERVRVPALVDGGGQEHGMRGGTLNVPGIVGLGEAVEVACSHCGSEADRLSQLRDNLEQRLAEALPAIRFNGKRAPRLPNTSNTTFPGDACEYLLMGSLGELAISPGSACASGRSGASHVLSAMGIPPNEARRSARISLGRPTTEADTDRAAEIIIGAVRALTAT